MAELGEDNLDVGPRLSRIGKSWVTTIDSITAWLSRREVRGNSLSPNDAAAYVGVHVRTLENWRKTWDASEAGPTPAVCIGPAFYRVNGRVFYEQRALSAFVETLDTSTKGDLPADTGWCWCNYIVKE